MGKGGKLKEMLSHQKEQEKLDKKEKFKKEKRQVELKKNEPKVVTVEDIVASEAPKLEEQPEVYQSKALSKKEKRKLKKQMMKEQKEEQKQEQEEEQEQVQEDLEDLEETQGLNLDRLAQSDSEEDENEDEDEDEQVDIENEEEEEEQDVPLSDVEFDSDADVVPYQKLTMNNTKALNHSFKRIQLPWNRSSFVEHLSVTSKANTDEDIKDIYDDTEREVAFYKQSLDAVMHAREELKRQKIPFKRPLDYFAEMVKSDEHMDKIKGKLVQEASEKKARQDARRQRDLKKFGKQVQVATLQKRQLEKKDTLEKIKALKNKRKHSEIGEDEFTVGVEEAAGPTKPKMSHKREAKNSKYGQGGMKRFKRKNDASSTADVSDFSHRKMKGRPGKSRRQKKH